MYFSIELRRDNGTVITKHIWPISGGEYQASIGIVDEDLTRELLRYRLTTKVESLDARTPSLPS